MKNSSKFLITGITFLVLGFGVNRWTLVSLLPFFDMKLTLPREILMAIFNIFFSGLGILAVFFRSNQKKLLFSALLFLFSFGVLFIGGEIMVRLFSSTYNYYPATSPTNPYKFGPPTGRIFKPNYEGTYKSKEYDVEFRANSEGFRSSQEFIVGDQDTKTVAVLGDSIVAAREVSEEKTFVKLLESELGGLGIKQVQNYGMPGTGITYYLQTYQSYVKNHHPSVVVIGIFNNDFYEFNDFSPFWAYGLLDQIDLFLMGHSALYKFTYLQYEQSRAGGSRSFPEDNYAYESPWNEKFKAAYQHFSDNLSQMIYEIKNDGAVPVIILMPSLTESSDAVWEKLEKGYNLIGGKNTLDRDRIRNELRTSADKMGVEFIDPTDAFREAYASGEILHFPHDRHLNPAGHQVIAEILSPKISEIFKK